MVLPVFVDALMSVSIHIKSVLLYVTQRSKSIQSKMLLIAIGMGFVIIGLYWFMSVTKY